MQRRTIVGWQLPYLRVALILRRLRQEAHQTGKTALARREIVIIERVRSELCRAGWFN
jgi:hypothetical protein